MTPARATRRRTASAPSASRLCPPRAFDKGSSFDPARRCQSAAAISTSVIAVFRDEFADGGAGPELIIIPDGGFLMGSAESEARLQDDDRAFDDEIVKDKGKRLMHIARRFALGRYPVTFEDYDAFLAATKAERKRGEDEPDDRNWGRGRRPAINVSWDDAQA